MRLIHGGRRLWLVKTFPMPRKRSLAAASSLQKLGHSLELHDQELITTRANQAKGTSRTNQHAIVYRAQRRIADLCCHGVTMVQPAEARKGPNLASNFGSQRDRPTCWRVLREPQMRPIVMVQVDNLIPIVLNRERCVIRGIRGMGVRSGFMEHS